VAEEGMLLAICTGTRAIGLVPRGSGFAGRSAMAERAAGYPSTRHRRHELREPKGFCQSYGFSPRATDHGCGYSVKPQECQHAIRTSSLSALLVARTALQLPLTSDWSGSAVSPDSINLETKSVLTNTISFFSFF